MGLHECFQAQDLISYQRWPGGPPTDLAHTYNTYLIKTPRVYQEELYCYYAAARPGVLWTQGGLTASSFTIVSFLGAFAQVAWPSWGVSRFTFDGQRGSFIERVDASNLGNVSAAISGGFSYEPAGYVWSFGSNPIIDGFDAVVFDSSSMTYDSGLGHILSSDFRTASGAATIAFADMAVDRTADRLFVRWLANNRGQVSVYRLSTKTWLTDIYAPNTTQGIVLTHDGFVYLIDVADWVLCYDYQGTFYNAFKNPRREAYPGGLIYGWDQTYKRLLFLGGVANATDGASRLRIKAYFPVPDAATLSPPIPRQVPRAGRQVVFVSHLAGEGAEPLSGRQGQFVLGSSAAVPGATDGDGDMQAQLVTAAAGSATVQASSDAPVSVPDAPVPDEVAFGQTLVVDWITPTNLESFGPGGATVSFAVHVTGAVAGALTLDVYAFTTTSYGGSTFTGSGTNPDDLEATLSLIPGRWVLSATVTDSAGHHGYTESRAVYVGGATSAPPDTIGAASGDFTVTWIGPAAGATEAAQPTTFACQLRVVGAAAGLLNLTVHAAVSGLQATHHFTGSGTDPTNLGASGTMHPQTWFVTAVVHDVSGNMGQSNTIAITVT